MQYSFSSNKRWLLYSARFLNGVSLAFLLILFFGNIIEEFGKPEPSLPNTIESLRLIFFPLLTIVGLSFCWFKARLGGFITIISILIFHLIALISYGKFDFNIFIDINLLIGFLFVFVSCKKVN